MRHNFIIKLIVIITLVLCGWFAYQTRNPLRMYGVHYSHNPGGSETLDHIQFYRVKDNQVIKGPEITGTLLDVTYKDLDQDGIPEIIVKSRGQKTYVTKLRLNLEEKDRPDFEILETHMHNINYPPLGLNWP